MYNIIVGLQVLLLRTGLVNQYILTNYYILILIAAIPNTSHVVVKRLKVMQSSIAFLKVL